MKDGAWKGNRGSEAVLLGRFVDGDSGILPRRRAVAKDLDVADDLAATLDLEFTEPDPAGNAPGRAPSDRPRRYR